MRISFVYEYDAADPRVQSSRPYSILSVLSREHRVQVVSPLACVAKSVLAPLKMAHSLCGKLYRLEREPLVLREYAWRAEKVIRPFNPDIVFAPSQLVPTYLDVAVPLLYCNDAPFSGILDYPEMAGISADYKRRGYWQESVVHQNADRIIYPSEWAKSLAVSEHNAAPDKIVVAAFGANLPYRLSEAEVQQAVSARGPAPIRIVMVSSNWARKGGAFALRLVEKINQHTPSRLTVIGRHAPIHRLVDHLGFVDKWEATGEETFRRALLRSHFMILASYAEAYGMSLWEGAAHGLPVVGRAVGGISSIISPEFGKLFWVDDDLDAVAEWVLETANSPQYSRISMAAYHAQARNGNWDTFVKAALGGYL